MRNRPLQPAHWVRGTLVTFLGLGWSMASGAEAGSESGIQRGEFDVARSYGELVELLGTDTALDPIAADETVSWHMYVPPSYRPGEPAGLLVYISPTRNGQIRADWRPELEAENLIWISANHSGNRVPTHKRILLAMLAAYVAADRYEIDSERVYLSGFSGGGKAAGIASVHLAELFKGAIFICGAELRTDLEPAHIGAAASNRYVFVTGSRDFNLDLTRRTYRKYGRAGMVNSKLMIIRGMAHSTPDRQDLREALRFLDGNSD